MIFDALPISKALGQLGRLMSRFRYPVSLPDDVAQALGFSVSNFIKFEDFLAILTTPSYRVENLYRMMPRESAELVFARALRKERFHGCSLFSYYFPQGWVEFVLRFDDSGRLRRVYLQHRDLPQDSGYELALSNVLS